MEKSYESIADYFANLDIEWLKNYEILGVELERHFTIGDYDQDCIGNIYNSLFGRLT